MSNEATTDVASQGVGLRDAIALMADMLKSLHRDPNWTHAPIMPKGKREEAVGEVVKSLRQGASPYVWGVVIPEVKPVDGDASVDSHKQIPVCITGTGPHAEMHAQFIACVRAWLPGLLVAIDTSLNETEVERVRLAACGVAASDGRVEQQVPKDSPYHSAAYQAVLELRRAHDELRERVFGIVNNADMSPATRILALKELA